MSQLDNTILELRLLYKDSTVTLPSLSKCASKLHLYSKNRNDKLLLESFLNEVLLCKLEIEKVMKIFRTLELQKIEYDHLENKIENLIDTTKNNIILSEKELIEQKEIRSHRLKCEQIAARVNEYPNRTILKRKIDDQNISLNNTKSAIEQINLEIQTKKTLFDQLLKAIDELQKQSESDNILTNQVMDIDEDNAVEEDINIDRTSNNRIYSSNELIEQNIDDDNNSNTDNDDDELIVEDGDDNNEMKSNIICDICKQEYQVGTICQVCEGK